MGYIQNASFDWVYKERPESFFREPAAKLITLSEIFEAKNIKRIYHV